MGHARRIRPPAPAVPGYAELQAITNFSFLEGGSHPHEIIAQAKALGLAAIAVADRNTLAGVVRAHTAAKEAGIRLVVGARLDLEDAPSLLCYPRDRPAYGRLTRLLSLGQGRAEKGKCHLRLADVTAHAQGCIFIALAPEGWDWRTESTGRNGDDSQACDGTVISLADRTAALSAPACVSAADDGASLEPALRRIKTALASAAGLYLAASHVYSGDDASRIATLAMLAARCGLPLVATGNVLYHTAHRRPLQDVLSCIRAGVTIRTAGLRLAPNAERHLKAPMAMARLFRGWEAALANTLAIVETCRFSLDELVYEYPEEPVPPGTSAQVHLEALTWAGARWRFPDAIPGKVADAIVRELALIAQLDYAPYFLTVHDIVRFARTQGILCQGRGSAANSVVCYCLAITAVNPTEVDLLFERFISEARREPPDIDVDFEHERREEVIQYIYARYGRDRAGLAATVISYRARSAVREVGKAMGLSADTVAALAGMVWGSRSGGALPEQHVREAGLDPADPLLATVLALTDELVGFPRHLSQHVGGFVLTRGPLIEVAVVGNAAMDERTFIEWDKDDIAALGLLKVDVLALGMLSCIRRAFDLIARHHGVRHSLASVPRDDPAVYDMLCRADSIGVFQVESRAQMNMLPRLRPRTFYDLVIEVAIVRPGPIQGDMVHPYLRRRSGVEREEYPAPAPEHGPADELRQILSKTKGVPLFQEQAMRIALVAARFSDAEVNELRKAMATFRRRGTIGQLEEKMVSRMVARGYDPAFAQRCFDQIKGFGEYGFPESHAASFAHLVYVSSWIKHHYPAAFCAAILNSQPMGFYAPAQLVRDAREHGVEVRPADVGWSDWDSTLEEGPPPLARPAGEPHSTFFPLSPPGASPGRAEVEPVASAAGGGEGRLSADFPFSRPSPSHRCCASPLPPLPESSGRGVEDGSSVIARWGVSTSDAGVHPNDAKLAIELKEHCITPTPALPPPGGGGEAERAGGITAHAPCCHCSSIDAAKDTASRAGRSLHSSSPPPLGGRVRVGGREALRLGLRQIDGLQQAEIERLIAARTAAPFRDVHDLWRRAGVRLATLERLAAADAMRSLGFDRRQALWEVKGLGGAAPLPLFACADAREAAAEPAVALPRMQLSEHVVNDYQTLRLSLKAHPVSFLRPRLTAAKVGSCASLRELKDGAFVRVAGVILVRQRPGTAKGVVFMTLEDETGVCNAVVWPKTLERFRRIVMSARMIQITGRIQRHPVRAMDGEPAVTPPGQDDIIHVVSGRLDDLSPWLLDLTERGDTMPVAIARADEVLRPEPGSARGAAAVSPPPRVSRHPRDERTIPKRIETILPKSRDFH